jgi:hypothetical protein
VRVWALTSWFDEDPQWLRDVVESCYPLCAGVIALDGRYPLFPDERDRSDDAQAEAITSACAELDMVFSVAWTPPVPEVEKRTKLFRLALDVAEPMVDWFLIMDADQIVEHCPEPEVVKAELARTPLHAAEIACRDVPSYARPRPLNEAGRIPFLMRAMPGLHCEGRHSIYMATVDGQPVFPWSAPHGYLPTPPLDLTKHLLIHHFPFDRDSSRDAKRHGYYSERATANIEYDPGPFTEVDPPWMQELERRHAE